MKTKLIALAVSLLLGVTGCGGSSGGGGSEPPPPPPPPPPITEAEAFQFLNQATFGATPAEADRVIFMGFEAFEMLKERHAAEAKELPANPRNAAAGIIRRKYPSEAAGHRCAIARAPPGRASVHRRECDRAVRRSVLPRRR